MRLETHKMACVRLNRLRRDPGNADASGTLGVEDHAQLSARAGEQVVHLKTARHNAAACSTTRRRKSGTGPLRACSSSSKRIFRPAWQCQTNTQAWQLKLLHSFQQPLCSSGRQGVEQWRVPAGHDKKFVRGVITTHVTRISRDKSNISLPTPMIPGNEHGYVAALDQVVK
eukprot:6208237-Pleurochrysis_carterae.AAC.3